MSDETTLLPCPFCGGEAHMSASSDGYGVQCWNRRCIDMQMEEIPTEAEAIAAWNTRTATTDAEFARAVHDGNLWRRVKGHIRCRNCGLNIESVIALDGCNEHAIKHCPNCGATLGSDRHPYEQRITGDGSDWGEIMIDAFDDLMVSADESCTPEQMRQLADHIRRLSDHIRAEMGSGTCEFSPTTDNQPTCSNCGWRADAYDCDWLDGGAYEYDGRFCKSCGALVRKAVGR